MFTGFILIVGYLEYVIVIKMCAEKRDINLQRRQAMRRKGFEWKSTGVSVHCAVNCVCVLIFSALLFIYTHFCNSFIHFSHIIWADYNSFSDIFTVYLKIKFIDVRKPVFWGLRTTLRIWAV